VAVYDGIAALVLGNGCRIEEGDTLLIGSSMAGVAIEEKELLLSGLPPNDW